MYRGNSYIIRFTHMQTPNTYQQTWHNHLSFKKMIKLTNQNIQHVSKLYIGDRQGYITPQHENI